MKRSDAAPKRNPLLQGDLVTVVLIACLSLVVFVERCAAFATGVGTDGAGENPLAGN